MFGILEGSLVGMLEKVGGDIFGLIDSINGYTYIYIGSFVASIIIMIQIKVGWELKSKNIIDFIFYIWLAIILGEAIKLVNNKVIVSALSSYWIVATVIFLLMTAIFLKECFYYSNTLEQIVQNYCKVNFVLLLSVLFTQVVASFNFIWILNNIISLFFVWAVFNSNVKKHLRNTDRNEIADIPVNCYEDLFPTRKKEHDRIFGYLNAIGTDDPYAIAISAGWGEGKTSLISVLQKEIEEKNNTIIYIQPMILDTREKLLNYVFGQLEKILKANKIYTGKGSPYKKYFDLLLKFVDYKTITSFSGFLDVFQENEKLDLRTSKIELEKSIGRLVKENQRIYIIVDDLDRVEKETVYSTLTFIKEIVDLKKVTVLFLVDYKNIISENITIEYLEKFINQKFELSKIHENELLYHYIEKLIPRYDLDIINDEIEILKLKFKDHINIIKDYFKNEMESIDKRIKEEKNENPDSDIMEMKKLSDRLNEFQYKISNPRYVKKIILNTKETFNFLEASLINKSDGLYSRNNGIEISELIFKLNIFKVLFKEEYDEILKCGDIRNFLSNNEEKFILPFLREKEEFAFLGNEYMIAERKYDFYNSIIFSSEIGDEIFLEIKSENDRLLEELDLNNINEDSLDFATINKYLTAINSNQEGENEKRLKNRIELFTKMLQNAIEKEKIEIYQVFELLSEPQRNILIKSSYFFQEVNKILQTTDSVFSNKREREASKYHLKNMEWILVLNITMNLSSLLSVYYLSNKAITRTSLKSEFEDIVYLKDLNDVLIRILDIEIEGCSSGVIECFEQIFDVIKEGIKSNQELDEMALEGCHYFEKCIQDVIEVYRLKVEMLGWIDNSLLSKDKRFDIDDSMSSLEGVLLQIDNLYSYLMKENGEKNHQIFYFYHNLLNNLSSFISNKGFEIEEIPLTNLREILVCLNEYFKVNSDIYREESWQYCKIMLTEIEALIKNKR
ncbi:P-loop NTPase fold protein [Bacillus cereus group sp. BY17LC]|uniref:P-loop NTPase fold protein n=1 Tax=Bacillus cereus group sp. BY17LC TaxID=3018082 RepID=UPI0022E7E68D|nr:P-loop NTPase fold protein [Bacillus cereus group sp. BY17LC]MDA1836227.1 P-loop NTPase fold protein [Bacillus cereus group sp. BY17LC]